MSESLRDQLSEQFAQLEKSQDPAPVEVVTEAPAEPVTEAKTEAQPDKPGRTAGRARDEHGRLLPGPAKRPETNSAQETGKSPSAPLPTAQAQIASPAAELPKPKVPRPSSWKKDFWDHFDKLAETNPDLAKYINERESQFASGVSTYKQEADKAKSLWEAIAPFQPILNHYKIDPSQHIQRLFSAHQQLALGTPEQRLAMFSQLANDYQIPLEHLFVRGQDGQLYRNPNLQHVAQQQVRHPLLEEAEIRKRVQQELVTQQAQQEVERMRADAQKYPHFEAVRETMVGLLQAGLATNYDEAYTAAIRHPKHAEIFNAMQEQQRKEEEAKAAEEKRKAAEAARRNAISPRTSTPTAAASGGSGKKSTREVLSEAFDAHASGRV